MKRMSLFVAALAAFYFAPAQSTVLSSAEENETENPVKIMVIPFHPVRYYFSDCDKDISGRSKVQIEDVRASFRAALDYAAEAEIEKKYEPINIFQMKDSTSVDILRRFYDNVSYSLDDPTRPAGKGNAKILKELKKNMGGDSGNEKNKNTIPTTECYTNVEPEDEKYMKASFSNPDFFEELNTVYAADYYVTINQFEVKTDYEKCIDRELGVYARRIKIHYNIYSKSGKMIYGDVIAAKYNSTSNDVNQIIQDNFGFLSDYITKSLPTK